MFFGTCSNYINSLLLFNMIAIYTSFGAPIVEENLCSLISWNYSEMTICAATNTDSEARKCVLRYIIENSEVGALNYDIASEWEKELINKIYSHPERYVIRVDARHDAYYVRININQLMRDTVNVIFGEITPRVAIVTSEVVLTHSNVPDPAVQTAITSALLKYGFNVVDVSEVNKAKSLEAWRQAKNGDIKASKALSAELNADILIKGESMAEEHSSRDGFDARVEFSAVEGATGRVLASHSNTVRNINAGSLLIAAKTALQQAAETSCLQLCSSMLNAYGKPIIKLRVWNIKNLNEQQRIISGLKKTLPDATIIPVSTDLQNAKCAVISIKSKKSVSNIAEILESIKGIKLKVTEIECRSIVSKLDR